MTGKLKISGRLRLYIDGELVADASNLVVNSGLNGIWKAVRGDSGYEIANFKAGTGTAAITAATTALTTPTFTKAVTSVSFPATGALKVGFSIQPADTTAQDFKEFALHFTNGDMLSGWMDGFTYTYTALNTVTGVWDILLTT